VAYLRGAGYQGFHAGWHTTLRTTTVGYGGAVVGLRHALYRWGATQALWIPPIQKRILPYPRKVKLYPVNSLLEPEVGGVGTVGGRCWNRRWAVLEPDVVVEKISKYFY
jgi:hypothetical protein